MARERHYVGSKAKIGIVCDTILFDTIRSAAEFIYVSPTGDWREKTEHIDCFLAVSTWRGLKDDEWEGVNREDSALRQTLYDIIEDCRRRGIPTVFYSKEDPPNYDLFLGIARRCDVIFTSAVEMVPRYSSDCGHDHVHVLGFVIDPAVQNPHAAGLIPPVDGLLVQQIKKLIRVKYAGRLDDHPVKSAHRHRNQFRPEPPHMAVIVATAGDHLQLAALLLQIIKEEHVDIHCAVIIFEHGGLISLPDQVRHVPVNERRLSRSQKPAQYQNLRCSTHGKPFRIEYPVSTS